MHNGCWQWWNVSGFTEILYLSSIRGISLYITNSVFCYFIPLLNYNSEANIVIFYSTTFTWQLCYLSLRRFRLIIQNKAKKYIMMEHYGFNSPALQKYLKLYPHLTDATLKWWINSCINNYNPIVSMSTCGIFTPW